MHAHDDTATRDTRSVRPPARLGGSPAPRTPLVLSRGGVSPAAVTAVQRAAGNAAAAQMVQRTATAQQDAPQQSASSAPSHQAYEQTKEEYLKSGGPPVLYRSIRIQPQAKRRVGNRGETVPASPEGDLGEGASIKETQRIYQTLTEWDKSKNITPVDANAGASVGQHVGGDNYGTQYISCTPSQARATQYSRQNYALGPPENQESIPPPRAVKNWAPVVVIDVNQLGGGARLVNLGNPTVHGQTDLAGRSEISSMAKADSEVLIKGVIPGAAIVRVIGVEAGIAAMQEEEKRDLIESQFRLKKRPTGMDDPGEWDTMLNRNVPEHLRSHFEFLRAQEEDPMDMDYAPTSKAFGKRRHSPSPEAAAAEPAPPAARKTKKKKKANANLLSFADED